MLLAPGWPRWATGKTAALAALFGAAMAALPAQKDKDEPRTQTLHLPPELPLTVAGETRRLTFHVTPLSSAGLLSQQTRNALKALSRSAGNADVLHIRAFVAGTGDVRRVRDLVSEAFTARGKPLPALSLVRVGALPLPGAQVVLEAVAAGARDVNPNGLAFVSADPATSEGPLDPVQPLARKSLASLRQALAAAGAAAPDVVRVTCFFSSLDDLAQSRALVQAEYPSAALDTIQPQRAPARALAACEAVARLRRPPGARLRLLDAEGMPREPGASACALVTAPYLVLTGTQSSFGFEEPDAQLAFGRLRNALEKAGASAGDIVFARWYALSSGIAAQARKLRLEVFDPAHPPAGSLLVFEGLSSLDEGFAIDAVAARN
ncbi:MAG: Rid family hydrolase [Bryobacteraceae bacterium]|jgi:enamine deaminase RidA (YjgF/YER057c/UK114 family)